MQKLQKNWRKLTMANKTRVRELGRLLNIQTVARKKYELEESEVSNLDFLQVIFERELEVRRQNAIKRNRKIANLPAIVYDENRLHAGIKYQVKQLESCEWVSKIQNILISGKPNKSKTAIAAHLASTAIDKGHKAFYISLDEFLMVAKSKDALSGAKLTFGRIVKSDILVIDDFLYLDLLKQDLELLYKLLISLTSTTSIIFVSNRDPKDWIRSNIDDKYTLEFLISRAIAKCERMLV